MLCIEVLTAAATSLATHSCAATPRQSAAQASCANIFNTLIWSAVGFAAVRASAWSTSYSSIFNMLIWSAVGFADVRVSARAAATQSPLCPALHALIWQQQRERVRVGERATVRHLRVILSLCVCLCGACVRMCTCVRHIHTHSLTQSHSCLCVRLSSR